MPKGLFFQIMKKLREIKDNYSGEPKSLNHFT